MPLSNKRKLFGTLFIASAGTAASFVWMALVGDEKLYRQVMMPAMHRLDAETAHKVAVTLSSWGIVPRWTNPKYATDKETKQATAKRMATRVFGIDFESPIGLAAGFDKDARALGSMFRLGFSFVEVGSVTPLPQSGNPKPRVFRLKADEAVINQYGFNSQGAEQVAKRVAEFGQALADLRRKSPDYDPTTDPRNVLHVNFYSPDVKYTRGLCGFMTGPPHDKCVVAVNLGKNKEQQDAVADYTKGLAMFGDKADFIVINLSSPNTPGLRSLQSEEHLEHLLKGIDSYLASAKSRPKILVKLAPDLNERELAAIAKVATKWSPKVVTGLVMGNTTISRPTWLKSDENLIWQKGGLSGKPLTEMSTQKVARLYKLTGGRLPIIGVGGVASGRDAFDKITAGASLVELYSAMVFEGPPVVDRVKRELNEELKKHGFNNVADAVGTRADDWAAAAAK